MEDGLKRMEALLARLEAVADSLSRGPGGGAASGASVPLFYPPLSKEELERQGKEIDRIIEKQRYHDASPPIAD